MYLKTGDTYELTFEWGTIQGTVLGIGADRALIEKQDGERLIINCGKILACRKVITLTA